MKCKRLYQPPLAQSPFSSNEQPPARTVKTVESKPHVMGVDTALETCVLRGSTEFLLGAMLTVVATRVQVTSPAPANWCEIAQTYRIPLQAGSASYSLS